MLQRVLVTATAITSLFVKLLQRLGFSAQNNFLDFFGWLILFIFLFILFVFFRILFLVLLIRLFIFLLLGLLKCYLSIGSFEGWHFFQRPQNIKYLGFTGADNSLAEITDRKMKHLDHAMDLSTHSVTRGRLKLCQSLEVGQLLQITSVVLLELFSGIRFFDRISSGLLLILTFLSTSALSFLGLFGLSSLLFSFLLCLGNSTAFLFFSPFDGGVENGAFRRCHITKDKRNR